MKEINEELLKYYILLLTEKEGNINYLVNENIGFLRIKLEMDNLIKRNLISDKEGLLKITLEGQKEFRRLKRKHDLGNIESMIVPDYSYEVEKIRLDDVYLP